MAKKNRKSKGSSSGSSSKWWNKKGKKSLQAQVSTVAKEVNPVLTTAAVTNSAAINSTNQALGSTNTTVASLSTSTNTNVAALSTATSSALSTTNSNVTKLSTTSSSAEASLSTATNSLSTTSSSAEASLSTATNSLSTATASALDLNQLYSDQNQIFGAAAQFEVLGNLGGAFAAVGDGGVSVTGGVSGADNTAYAGNVVAGNLTAAFGIEYTGSTLYGYSPDPDFVQSTPINATLNGALATGGDLTTWSLLGGNGNDSIIGGDNNDTAVGGAGTDSISGGAGLDSLLGEAGNDTIDGGLGADSISGAAGDDSILGGAGANTIEGGLDNDTIVGGNDGDSILGGLGTDSIVSGSGNDTIYGGDGNDTIVGSSGQDSLFGEAGDNLFQFGNAVLSTSTTLDGGAGTNTLSFTQDPTTAVDADFTNVTNIDRIYTADGAGSSLTLGTEASEAGVATVQGGNGADAFTLEKGFTTTVSLFGGAGEDTFTVNSYSQIDPSGTSQDYIDGEAGTADVLAFATEVGTSGATAVINDSNVAHIEILQLADTGSNYVQLDGNFGIDTIIGGSTNSNYINAQGLTAGNAITLIGGSASDTLLAGPGSDWLQGFADGVAASSASDTLTGGDLSDTFVLGDSAQNAYAGGGVQATINGFTIDGAFSPVTSDLFRLFTNTAAVAGKNPANFVAAGATWVIQDAGAAAVYTIAYTDGAGVGIGTITDNLAGTQIASFNYTGSGANFSASNFLLA